MCYTFDLNLVIYALLAWIAVLAWIAARTPLAPKLRSPPILESFWTISAPKSVRRGPRYRLSLKRLNQHYKRMRWSCKKLVIHSLMWMMFVYYFVICLKMPIKRFIKKKQKNLHVWAYQCSYIIQPFNTEFQYPTCETQCAVQLFGFKRGLKAKNLPRGILVIELLELLEESFQPYFWHYSLWLKTTTFVHRGLQIQQNMKLPCSSFN